MEEKNHGKIYITKRHLSWRRSFRRAEELKGKKAIVVVGGGAMKRQGFLAKVEDYLKEAGMEVALFEGVEPDPSVETVMKGAKAMQEFEPDWIVAMGGGSPIDAAKAMWAFYEYPEITFEDLITPFSFPELRQKAKFAAIPSTSERQQSYGILRYHRLCKRNQVPTGRF